MVTALGVAALDAGDAWFETDDDHTAHGAVCGVFSRAVYLRFGGRLLALCRADVVSGPLHVRVRSLPALGLGDPVVFEGGRLELGSMTVAVPADRRWRPPPVPVAALSRMARIRPPWRPPPDPAVAHLGDLVARRDLVALARLVGGRGPGLTPAGDDLLAGVLVIDALLHPDDQATRCAAAQAAATTDVAAAFLRWAALGQCIEPFHRVVSAIAEDHRGHEDQARADLRATGASSGRALLCGLDLGLSRP